MFHLYVSEGCHSLRVENLVENFAMLAPHFPVFHEHEIPTHADPKQAMSALRDIQEINLVYSELIIQK